MLRFVLAFVLMCGPAGAGLVELPPGSCAGGDDTAAIAAAISNASMTGGTVVIPASVTGCRVSTGFTLPAPIGIVGEGPGARIVGTLPNNADLFSVNPAVGQIFRYGYSIDQLTIDIDGGRNALIIDTRTCNCFIGGSSFSRINTLGSTSLTGASIAVRGTEAPYRGLFGSSFENNFLISTGPFQTQSAYYFVNFGDSNRIVGGGTSGVGYSIFLDQAHGAGNFTLSGGSLLTACGGIYITRATAPILRDFHIETLPYTTSLPCTSLSGATIHLGVIGDATKAVSTAVIGPGQIQVIAGSTSYSSAIILANSTSTKIDGLRATNGATGTTIGVWVLNTSIDTRFGSAMFMSGWTTNYLDSGIGTTHPDLVSGGPL